MLVFFFAINQISCNWSLITTADFLASRGDDGMYLKIFTLMQPASVLSLPLVDFVVQRYGFGAAFRAVNVINFVYILIKCTSTSTSSLHMQVATFLCVAAVRCFLYACIFSCLPQLLSGDVVGRGTEYLAMVGGIASLLNTPLNFLTVGGDFIIPNMVYLCAVFPCTVAAWRVNRVIKLESKIKATSQ